jgi:hypothetical protein
MRMHGVACCQHACQLLGENSMPRTTGGSCCLDSSTSRACVIVASILWLTSMLCCCCCTAGKSPEEIRKTFNIKVSPVLCRSPSTSSMQGTRWDACTTLGTVHMFDQVTCAQGCLRLRLEARSTPYYDACACQTVSLLLASARSLAHMCRWALCADDLR